MIVNQAKYFHFRYDVDDIDYTEEDGRPSQECVLKNTFHMFHLNFDDQF